MITRRVFVAAGALPIAAFCIPARAHVHLDYRKCGRVEHEFLGGKCFVDGRQIAMVFYVDTREGIVRTYDAFGDGKLRTAPCPGFVDRARRQKSFAGLKCVNGVFHVILRGRIELYLSDGAPR